MENYLYLLGIGILVGLLIGITPSLYQPVSRRQVRAFVRHQRVRERIRRASR